MKMMAVDTFFVTIFTLLFFIEFKNKKDFEPNKF
jgi:hypothetical protein